MHPALPRTKDGESRASAVESIFGYVVGLPYRKVFIKLLVKVPAGSPGAGSESQFFKSQNMFLPDLI